MFRMIRRSQGLGNQRRGAAIVEMAVVTPVLFILIFGMIEFGRLVMVAQILTNGTREAARYCAVEGETDAEVQQWAKDYLTKSGIPLAAIQTVTVSDDNDAALNYTTLETGDRVKVKVTLETKKCTWLSFLLPATHKIAASSVMRRE